MYLSIKPSQKKPLINLRFWFLLAHFAFINLKSCATEEETSYSRFNFRSKTAVILSLLQEMTEYKKKSKVVPPPMMPKPSSEDDEDDDEEDEEDDE